MSQTYGCSLLWTKSLTCIGSFSMDAVTQMCYVFFHLFFNVSPIQKWVWVRWLHIGTGDNYARHTVLWFRRSSRKVKGVEVFIKEERNVSYATACTARNPLLHWQKCQGCYFLWNALLNAVSSATFRDIYQLFFTVTICDNLMNSNLPHPRAPAPREIQRQTPSFTRQDSSVTASPHQPPHSPQAPFNLFSRHNCRYSLSCFGLTPA